MTATSSIFFFSYTSFKMHDIQNINLFQEIFGGHCDIVLSRNILEIKVHPIKYWLYVLFSWFNKAPVMQQCLLLLNRLLSPLPQVYLPVPVRYQLTFVRKVQRKPYNNMYPHWVFCKVTLNEVYGFPRISTARIHFLILSETVVWFFFFTSKGFIADCIFYNLSDTSVWHYHMGLFNIWTMRETYLYLWTMKQMVWEKDLSCVAVQCQTLSQHFLAELYMRFMPHLLSALPKYRVLFWFPLRLESPPSCKSHSETSLIKKSSVRSIVRCLFTRDTCA